MLSPVLASPQVLTASQWPATVEISCLVSAGAADPLLTPASNAEAILEREWTLMLHCDGHVTCVRGMKPSCLHPADGCSGEFWATFRTKIPCQKPGVISLTIVPDKLLAKQSSPTGSCCCSSSATTTSSDSWHCCQSVQLFVSPNAAVTNELQDMFAAMQGVITAQQQQRKQQQQMLLSSSSLLQSYDRQQLPAPWHPLQEQQQQQQGLLHTSNGAVQSWAAPDGAFAQCPAPCKDAFMKCDLLDVSQEQSLPFATATASAAARRCSCSCSCVAAELAASDILSCSSSTVAAAAVATWLGHFQPLLADMQTVFRYIANVSNPDGCINSSSHENSNSCSSHSAKSSGCSTAPECGLPTAAEAALISNLNTPADAVGHVFISLLEFLAMHECWCSVSYMLAQAFSSGLLSDADVICAVQAREQQKQQQPYAASAVVASLIASLTSSSSSSSMSAVEMS